MSKRRSPFTDTATIILDEIQEHNVLVRGYKSDFLKLLDDIEFNLSQAWQNSNNMNLAQALGLVKGAKRMFGK